VFFWCLVHPVVFAAITWSLEPWGRDCPAVFWVSMYVVVPCGCSVFIALLVWHCGFYYSLAVLCNPSLRPPLLGIYTSFFFHWAIWLVCDGCLLGAWWPAWGACGLVVGWADQSGVLVPWGCGLHRHLSSTSNLGVNQSIENFSCDISFSIIFILILWLCLNK